MSRAAIIAGLALLAPAASAQTITPTVIQVDANEVWGYRSGVKQTLGSYKLGRSVHNISQRTDLDNNWGEPDRLLLVDEHAGTAEIVDLGIFTDAVINPGGMATFADGGDGSIWLATGGRADELPFDLRRSTAPYSTAAWDLLLDNFVTSTGSTTILFQAVGDVGLAVWREGGSSSAFTKIRFYHYDLTDNPPSRVISYNLFEGDQDPELGKIGLEQGWMRWDPREQKLAVTWQWWDVDDRHFGSNPFLYTDDLGWTWRSADGAARSNLPISWSERDDVLVPDDHVARGEDTLWHPHEIGWTPDGTPWLLNFDDRSQSIFYRWTGDQWESTKLTERLLEAGKPVACGTTRDYVVLLWGEAHRLFARTTRDNGATWSEPVLVHEIDPSRHYGWVSFMQPAERYLDNQARFLVGYFDPNAGNRAKNYRLAIDFVKLQVGPRADFDRNAVVDTRDVLAFLNAYANGDWTADFTDDGVLDIRDITGLLNAFASER